MGIADEAGDFVGFVGDEGFGEEALEGNVGEFHLRGNALFGSVSREACQLISGACRGGFGEQGFQVREAFHFTFWCGSFS